jgi:hypothetical protein
MSISTKLKAIALGSTLLVSSFLFTGCSSSKYDMYTGITKQRVAIDNGKVYSKFYNNPSVEHKISKDKIIDIRLQGLIINQVFESFKSLDNKNELGIFLTISEKDITDNNTTNGVNGRLVYKSAPRKAFAPLNQSNKLLYRTKYNGGDLYLKVEVVEFDKETVKNYSDIIDSILEATNTLSFNVSKEYTDMVDNVSKNVLKYTKDDLILSFETELLASNSVKDNAKQQYLQIGDLIFIRTNQDTRNYDINKEIEYDFDNKSISYTNKNNPQSSLILSIIERKQK